MATVTSEKVADCCLPAGLKEYANRSLQTEGEFIESLVWWAYLNNVFADINPATKQLQLFGTDGKIRSVTR